MVESSAEIDRVVLLAGGVKPSPLARLLGAPTLDLPILPDRTLLDLWLEAFEGAREVRLVHRRDLPPRSPAHPAKGASFVAQPDKDDFRGPAGITRDVTEDMAPESLVLIAESARFPAVSLRDMLAAHRESGADITLGVNPDRSPGGLLLFRRELIADVAEQGFTDLKEQWLGRLIKGGADVRAFDLEAPGAFLIRSPEAAIEAARWADELLQAAQPDQPDRPADAHEPAKDQAVDRGVRVVQPGATVDPTARVIDSIVMSGARVGPGAIVARSILCPSADIPSGAEVVGRVIGGPGGDEPAAKEAEWRS